MENYTENIIKKDEMLILGFIWQLIHWYDVKGHRAGPNVEDLLVWLNRMLFGYDKIKDIASGWQDGKQLASLIEVLVPELLPADLPDDPFTLTQLCIETARKELCVRHTSNSENPKASISRFPRL